MVKTVDTEIVKQRANQELDQNGYYTVTVNQKFDHLDERFGNTVSVKLKQKLQPAEGADDIKIGVTMHVRAANKTDIPEFGFTTIMESAFISHAGDFIQAVLLPKHVNGLTAVGANYTHSILITIPYSDEEYVLLSPGEEYIVTIDLHQPEPVVAEEVIPEKVEEVPVEVIDPPVKEETPKQDVSAE